MPIMNYTTKVDAFKSIGEISSNLSKHGAKRIMQEYGNSGEPIAIAFSIDTGYGERFYSLPARVDAVHETLTKQKVKCSREQATRVAWRILKDWIDAQMAIIESGMTETEEIFLPYMTNAAGETVYSLFKENNLLLTAK